MVRADTATRNGWASVRDAAAFRVSRKALGMLLLSGGMLAAADPAHVEKTLYTTPNPRVSLSNLTGQVVVRGWSRTQVHAVCTTSSPRVELETSVFPESFGREEKLRAEKIHFDTHVLDPLATGKDQGTDYSIEVPFGSSLEITNRQGSVTIDNLQGETSVECVAGAITARDVSGHLVVRTVAGDIEVMRPSGRVEASSITGNLHFISATGSRLRGVSTSGKILYEGDLVAGGDYALSSYSGDIDILCPSSASFELNAKTVKGKFDNALALTPNRRSSSPLSPSNSLLGTHNTGTAIVDVKSFSGTIRIRPQP